MRSKIILSDDLDRTLSQVIDKLKGQRIVTPYERDEFLIDDAKSVIHEAYLTSDTIKYLILKANKFNLASQNTLLKILEEPPENIIFIINKKTS